MIECTVKYGSVDIAKRYDDGLAVLAFFFQVQRVLKIGLLIFLLHLNPPRLARDQKICVRIFLKGLYVEFTKSFFLEIVDLESEIFLSLAEIKK